MQQKLILNFILSFLFVGFDVARYFYCLALFDGLAVA